MPKYALDNADIVREAMLRQLRTCREQNGPQSGSRIIAERQLSGMFRSIDDLRETGLPTEAIARLRDMHVAMAQVPAYKRE